MKLLIVVFISIIILSPCFAQQDLLPAFTNEISYNGDIAYFNGSRFTGLLVDEKTNKKMGEFKNGFKNGIFIEYYANGKKKSEGKYLNGKKEELHTNWLDDGRKEKEEYYKNGQIITFSKYHNDKVIELLELSTEFYSNGKKKNEGYIKDGNHEGQWVSWFENGEIEFIGNYKDGEKEGQWTNWYEDGQKKSEGYYNKGIQEGQWNNWFNDGRIKSRGNYLKGKKNGEFIEDEDIGGQKTIHYTNGNIDVHTTNSVIYYKPANNSKLLRVLLNKPNKFKIINFIIESNAESEANLLTLKNTVVEEAHFQEIPESEYNAYNDNVIEYKLYYEFHFEIKNYGSHYLCTLRSLLRLMDIYNKKVAEDEYSSYSNRKPTKGDALLDLISSFSFVTNKFIDEYFPRE